MWPTVLHPCQFAEADTAIRKRRRRRTIATLETPLPRELVRHFERPLLLSGDEKCVRGERMRAIELELVRGEAGGRTGETYLATRYLLTLSFLQSLRQRAKDGSVSVR